MGSIHGKKLEVKKLLTQSVQHFKLLVKCSSIDLINFVRTKFF
jgi:hypothetical protein